jgi:hypothetical protein
MKETKNIFEPRSSEFEACAVRLHFVKKLEIIKNKMVDLPLNISSDIRI